MPLNYFDRERAALARLLAAVEARAAAETAFAAGFKDAADKADRDVQKARKATAAARQKALAELDAAHAAAVEAAATDATAEKAAIDAARDDRKRTTTERFRVADQKGRAEHKDKLWSIDSLLEAGQERAREQQELLRRKAAAADEQARGLWTKADPELAQVGLRRDDVAFGGDAAPPDDGDPVDAVQAAVDRANDALDTLAGLFWPGMTTPAGLFLLLVAAAGVTAGLTFPFLPLATAAGITGGAGVALGAALWFAVKAVARSQVRRAGAALGERLAEVGRAAKHLRDHADAEYAAEIARVTEKHARDRQKADDHYLPLFEDRKRQFQAEAARIDAEHLAASEQLARRQGHAAAAEQDDYRTRRAALEAKFDADAAATEAQFADRTAAATAARDSAWAQAAADWAAAVQAVAAEAKALAAAGDRLFPGWDAVADAARPLPDAVPEGVRYGELVVDLSSLPNGVPEDDRLKPAEPLNYRLPAFLPFPDRAAVVLKARDEGRAAAVEALQAMMLRFLTGLPAGKVRFTVIDPVGLGNNFAAFMHLADHNEALVTSQIWTEPRHIEKQLTDLTDHIASVIQKYLRNQYQSIEEYNRAAGEVAEPYRVLVIANFPANFTPEAARRLVSIVNSGPSCGVCTLISVDTRVAMPRDFALADLEQAALTLGWKDGAFVPKDAALAAFPLTLDRPPDTEVTTKLVHRVGLASKSAAKVEVPFEYIAPTPDEVWAGDAGGGFSVPIGRAGATRRQLFSVGKGTAQHALIAGKTGSGKSTLLHALITNLALRYSPDEAELYLIDFKKGVEFKDYAEYRLPHARVVAIESEREFGLSVLQRLDGILRERGDAFRDAGVNDLAGYRRYLRSRGGEVAGSRGNNTSPPPHPTTTCPRILFVVDEFQEFFVEDDKLAQEASLLLDRLVRQGRAFGMHVLLGSQTLGGAYSIPRATIDQMAIRVALQCSEADAQMILNKDNTAARLLTRPGEAIYNDANGLIEGNDPFQVVWLADGHRDQLLAEIRDRAAGRYPPPLVFEGNAPADPGKNAALTRALAAAAPTDVRAPVAWLGEPIAIKEPTAAVFRQQGAANLLVLGQNEEAARATFAAALVGLAAQVPAPEVSGSTFSILDATPDDAAAADDLRRTFSLFPEHARAVDRTELPAVLGWLAGVVEQRQSGASADRSPRFLFVFGLQRVRELRKADDDFGFGRRGDREPSPAERFTALLKDGPAVGVHVVAWCDTLANLNRVVDRQTAKEFGLRVLFQMSANDSSTLIDTPAAAKLGRNRALLVVEDQERPEKFRPYGEPPAEWLRDAAAKVRGRLGLSAVAGSA